MNSSSGEIAIKGMALNLRLLASMEVILKQLTYKSNDIMQKDQVVAQ
jgi:hypothetical protein